jgi:hypothetical protein
MKNEEIKFWIISIVLAVINAIYIFSTIDESGVPHGSLVIELIFGLIVIEYVYYFHMNQQKNHSRKDEWYEIKSMSVMFSCMGLAFSYLVGGLIWAISRHPVVLGIAIGVPIFFGINYLLAKYIWKVI